MRNKYYSGMPQDKYSGIHDGENHRTIPANYVFLFTGPRFSPNSEAGIGHGSGTGSLPVELRLRPHGRFFPGPARETTGKMPVPLPAAVSISEFGFSLSLVTSSPAT